MSTEKKPHRNSAEMFPLIEAFEQSGKTLEQFCQEHSIVKTTFQYWQRKYHQSKLPQTSSEGFVSMKVSRDTVEPEASIEVIYLDGTRLRCAGGVKAEWLKSVLPVFSGR